MEKELSSENEKILKEIKENALEVASSHTYNFDEDVDREEYNKQLNELRDKYAPQRMIVDIDLKSNEVDVSTEDMEESCNEIDLTEVFEEALDVTNDTEDEEFNKELEELMQYSSDITLPDEVVLEVSDIN